MKINFLEGISPVVYHATSIVDAFKILNSGHFLLTPTYHADIESTFDSQLFYLSTTRSRLGSYHRGNNSMVLFELDGRKIAQRYSGKPIDYWGKLNKDSEMEDRIVSNTPTLPVDVIMGIEISANDIDSHVRLVKSVKFLYLFAKKNKIPIHVYRDTPSLVKKDRRNLLSHQEIMALASDNDYEYKSKPRPISDSKLYHFVRSYYEPYQTLPDSSKSIVREIFNSRSSIQGLKAEMKSARMMDSPQLDKLVYRVGEIMKKEKVTTLEDLFERMKVDIQSSIKDENDRHRKSIHQKLMDSNRPLYDHIMAVMNGSTTFDVTKLGVEDYQVMSKIDNIINSLDVLGFITQDMKEKWFEYGTLSDKAWREWFNIDV